MRPRWSVSGDDLFGPAHHEFAGDGVDELSVIVEAAEHELVVPRPDRHVGDRLVGAGDLSLVG